MLNKTNGQVYLLNDEINHLPGYIQDEILFEGQISSIPNFNHENTDDLITINAKQQISKEINNDQQQKKDKSNTTKLKTFEIVFHSFVYFFNVHSLKISFEIRINNYLF